MSKSDGDVLLGCDTMYACRLDNKKYHRENPKSHKFNKCLLPQSRHWKTGTFTSTSGCHIPSWTEIVCYKHYNAGLTFVLTHTHTHIYFPQQQQSAE